MIVVLHHQYPTNVGTIALRRGFPGRCQKDPASVVYRIGDGREPRPKRPQALRVQRAVTGSWAASARVGRPLFRGRRGTRRVRGSRPSEPVSLYAARRSVVDPLLSFARLWRLWGQDRPRQFPFLLCAERDETTDPIRLARLRVIRRRSCRRCVRRYSPATPTLPVDVCGRDP